MSARVLLKDIASFSKGEQINGENLIEDGIYPYLNGGIQPSGRWTACNASGNTITISEGGNSCGYVNLMTEPFWCGAHCYYLYDLSVDVQYLYFALKSQQARLMGIRTGACMPNINKNDLGCFDLTIHTEIAEQKRIVQQLLLCQTVIEQRQRQLRTLDTLIKARFVEMTQSSVTTSVRMGDVATYVNGFAFKPSDWTTEGLPIIRIQNLNDKEALYNHFAGTIDSKYCVHTGDILVSWATHLEAYVWQGGDAWLNQHIFRVIFDKMPINRIYYVYSTEEALRQAFRNAHGFKPTMEHIKRSDFENAIIELPPIEIQEEFAAFVSQVDKSKVAVQAALEKAKLLFDSLMQQYFG